MNDEIKRVIDGVVAATSLLDTLCSAEEQQNGSLREFVVSVVYALAIHSENYDDAGKKVKRIGRGAEIMKEICDNYVSIHETSYNLNEDME